MSLFDQRYWARTAMATVVVSAGVLVSMRLANAVPGGETRPSLSFSGTLSGAVGTQMLTFTFKKGASTVCAPRVSVTPSPSGQFTTEIPLADCAGTLFDGSDVTFDVSVGSTIVARDQAVNPVPYARYADRVGTPDCPTGYERDRTAMGIIACRKGQDEVVRVGTGASAFWIDRFEASVWQNADGTGTQYGAGSDNYPSTFPDNGQARPSNFVFAVSKTGVTPSAHMTWFQAQIACRASGKRLPSNEEWTVGALSTEDPGPSAGAGGACLTMASGPRETGRGQFCVSVWGAQDMIGNLDEIMSEWANSAGDTAWTAGGWGGAFPGDITYGIGGRALAQGGPQRIPAVAWRGGRYDDGAGAGLGTIEVASGPTSSSSVAGFRCVIPR